MGLSDTFTLHYEEVLTGVYWDVLPKTPNISGTSFQYDIVNDFERNYAKLLDNLQADSTVMTIKTDDDITFKVKGYIKTQDGLFWQVSSFIKGYVNENTKYALRLVKESIQTTKIVRLIQIENPYDL